MKPNSPTPAALDLPFELVLASSSPRRKELLSHLGLNFIVKVVEIKEARKEHEEPMQYALRNAYEKALASLNTLDPSACWAVIGADTIGVLEDQVLEKPKDKSDAARMLSFMSGKTHQVITAVHVLYRKSGQIFSQSVSVETDVTFKNLAPQEIQYYVNTGEPLDKAGSYGIQGIGGFLVEGIRGSFSNVVGLPLVELTELLLNCKSDYLSSK